MTNLQQRYHRVVQRRGLILGGFAAALMITFLLDLTWGPSSFSLRDMVRALLQQVPLAKHQSIILWKIRLPHAMMAVLAGSALGLAGIQMQTVLNNPLASPYTLGLSSAAILGAALALAFDLAIPGISPVFTIPAVAFACALSASLLVQWLAGLLGASVDTLILFGISMVFVCNALVSLIQFVTTSDTLQQIVFWTMGSLGRTTWPKIGIVATVLVLATWHASRQVWSLTALRSGADQAQSMGVPVERLRLRILVQVSCLAAITVSFVGAIGFIGLVGPHMARLALGEDHRFTLAGSMLSGALVLSSASLFSKIFVTGTVIPIGIVTAIVGIPLFMLLIFGQRRHL